MKRMCYGWVCWIASILLPIQTQANDQQRYLAIMLLNLDRSLDADLDLLEGAVTAGCNAVHLTIHWDQVYPAANATADWRKYDKQIALAQKLGAKIALRIYLGRNEGRIQGFWTNEQRQRDQQGRALVAGYASTYFTYADRPSVEKARAFIKEVCERYIDLQKQGVISWVSVCSTPTQETGYFHENSPDGSPYPTVFDYSPAMKTEFRIWLNRKYKKIERLNVFWQTEYKSFEEIEPATSLKNRDQTFWGESGKDWYVFRHAIFKQFIEQTTQTIKGVEPTYRVITDFGSVFDQLSAMSCSLAFRDLNQTTDGVKINDDVHYDHRFSIDVLRSNVLPGQWVLNEVFPQFQYGEAAVTKQIDENFAHGAHWISVVIGTKNVLEQSRPVIQKSVTKWLKMPYERVSPKAFMTYSLARVLEFGYFSGGVYGEWANRAGPESVRQPVDIRMVEDLLADSLQGSINRPPFVKNTLPLKIIKVNTAFSYRLSSAVFIDLDGAISTVEVRNLPDWLQFSNATFTGTPPRTGKYTMTLRATDDDGAWVETDFTILVDNEGRINQRPTLRKPIPDAIGLYKQPFITALAEDFFFDPDGFISRLEIIGLPSWAQYRKSEIRGLADTVGEFTVSVRAFDDNEAEVATTFNLIINYPTVSFDLIQAGKPGQRFLIKRLEDKEELPSADLPNFLNIYSSCDAVFDAFDLALTGPFSKMVQTNRSPYGLFEGDEGFVPVVGRYFLKGTAYFRKELISSTTYQFEIVPTDPLTKQRLPIDDWAVYPNPCRDFVNIKMPQNILLKRYELATLVGQSMAIPDSYVFQTGQYVSLNLGQLNLHSGIYFLKIQNEDTSWRVFKIVKQ